MVLYKNNAPFTITALSFLFLSLRLVCVCFLVLFTVQFLIFDIPFCREYKLLTLLHSIDPTNYLFTNWFFTFFVIFLRRRVCECLEILSKTVFFFFLSSFVCPTQRGLSLKYITLNLFTHNSLPGAIQVSATRASNHAGAQNARRRSRLMVVAAVMVVVKTGVVATMMVVRHGRRRRRLLSGVGGGHRSSLLRRHRKGRCRLARLGSVPEPAAGLLPLALGAPLLLVVHAVHLAALFVLAAGAPVRRKRRPVRPRTRARCHEAAIEAGRSGAG